MLLEVDLGRVGEGPCLVALLGDAAEVVGHGLEAEEGGLVNQAREVAVLVQRVDPVEKQKCQI